MDLRSPSITRDHEEREAPLLHHIKSGSGWYFKTGTYVQSNPSWGEASDAVGQVVLYSLDVQHTP